MEERQREWAAATRSLQGLTTPGFEESSQNVLSVLTSVGGADAAEAARRRAEIAR